MNENKLGLTEEEKKEFFRMDWMTRIGKMCPETVIKMSQKDLETFWEKREALRGKIAASFTHCGLKCVVVHFKWDSFLCCVEVPKGHPSYGQPHDDIDVDCHGGLSFSGDIPGYSGLQGYLTGWVVGFDTMHDFVTQIVEVPSSANEIEADSVSIPVLTSIYPLDVVEIFTRGLAQGLSEIEG